MKIFLKFLVFFISGFLLTSCAHRLAGTWQVQKYETLSQGNHHVTLQNIGTMTYYNDGSGDKQIEYSLIGRTRKDTMPFQWTATKTNVSIASNNSEFSKTWIIMEDKKKFQKWKSTDGENQVQILELVK